MTISDRRYDNLAELANFEMFVSDAEKTVLAFVKRNRGLIGHHIINRVATIQRKLLRLQKLLEEY